MDAEATGRSPIRIWVTAVRPFAYTASASTVVLGLCLSWYAGHSVHWGLFGMTLIGVVLLHTAGNLLNDCYDHRRGLDRKTGPTSGAVVRGWLTESQVFAAGLACLVLGAGIGLLLVLVRGPVVLILGVVGCALAVAYTSPGFCLKYRGFGDLAVFVAFGVFPVLGTFWVQAHAFSWLPVLWAIPLSLLAVGIVHANNWRDIASDSQCDCRTLAGILGARGSAGYYDILLFGPFVVAPLYLAAAAMGHGSRVPWPALIVFAALPKAIATRRAASLQDGSQGFAMLDGLTAQTHLLYSVLLCAGFLAGRILDRT